MHMSAKSHRRLSSGSELGEGIRVSGLSGNTGMRLHGERMVFPLTGGRDAG